MTPIIEAQGLTKRFGEVDALAGLDLVAESGQVTALLGPNGAGKTTFVSAVATLLRPDAGELRVAGIDVASRAAIVSARSSASPVSIASVEPAMTGRENLEFVARLFGLDRRRPRARLPAEVLDRLGLADAADRLVRTYSGGMRRRLDLGASLVGRPRLLLLDEPTTGLDPRSRGSCGRPSATSSPTASTCLLTTQYLEEADQLARQVVIVDHGRVVAAGTPDELKDRAGRDVIEVRPRAARRSPRGRGDPGDRSPPRRLTPTSTRSGRRRRSTADAEQLTTVVRLLDERQHPARRHRPAPAVPRRGVPRRSPDRRSPRPTR